MQKLSTQEWNIIEGKIRDATKYIFTLRFYELKTLQIVMEGKEVESR